MEDLVMVLVLSLLLLFCILVLIFYCHDRRTRRRRHCRYLPPSHLPPLLPAPPSPWQPSYHGQPGPRRHPRGPRSQPNPSTQPSSPCGGATSGGATSGRLLRLFHYTTPGGLVSIARDRVVRAGRGIRGWGVYLTSLDPSTFTREQLARNNYSRTWRTNLLEGRVDCFVEVQVEEWRLASCTRYREVFLHLGDLYLVEGRWRAGVTTPKAKKLQKSFKEKSEKKSKTSEKSEKSSETSENSEKSKKSEKKTSEKRR